MYINMQFKRRFRDKYASRSPERLCCLNSVRLVFLIFQNRHSFFLLPNFFLWDLLFVVKSTEHTANHILLLKTTTRIKPRNKRSYFKMKCRRLESIVMAYLTLVLSLLLTTANAQATQPTSYGRIKTKDDFSTSSRPVMIREVSQHTPTQAPTQAPTQTQTQTQTQTLSGIFLEKTASDTQSWNKGEKVWMAKIVTYVDDNFFYPTDCW